MSIITLHKETADYRFPEYCGFSSPVAELSFIYELALAIKYEIASINQMLPEVANVLEPFVDVEKKCLYLQGCVAFNDYEGKTSEIQASKALSKLLEDWNELDEFIQDNLKHTENNWIIVHLVGESPYGLAGLWTKRDDLYIHIGIGLKFIKQS